MSNKTQELFRTGEIKVINVGTEFFADAVRRQGYDCEQVDWRPPAGGDKELADLLGKMGI